MVAQQILREHGRRLSSPVLPSALAASLLLTGMLAWPANALADQKSEASKAEAERERATAEPVVVIDLRTGDANALRASRTTLIQNLGQVGGIELSPDPELSAALAGEHAGRTAADSALQRAQEAYGAVDCDGARTAARDAIARYAALEAGGDDTSESLRRAYVYELLCAHGQDDVDAAQRAASRLRTLGASEAPEGVSPAIWQRYPRVDAASNVFQSELAVTTVPAGAQVWIDHARKGPAPITVTLAQGPHLVAAATEKGNASRFVEVKGSPDPESVSVWIDEKPRRWDRTRRTVVEWKSGESPANAIALGVLMKEVGVRFAFVVAGENQVEVWALPGTETAARRVGTATASAHFRLGSIVLDRIAIWEGYTDESGLLGDGPNVVRSRGDEKGPQKWWVYAGIIGAVAIGAGILLAGNLADDHQRIELTWP